MVRGISGLVCVAVVMLLGAAPAATGSAPEARTLATKTLGNGATLLLKATDVEDLAPLKALGPQVVLTLEMQRPNVPAVQVASRLVHVWNVGEIFAGEIAMADSEIVVPIFPGGRGVGVWHVQVGAGDDWTNLESRPWEGMANALGLKPGEVTFAIKRGADQVWTIDAAGPRVRPEGRVQLRQDAPNWRFYLVPAANSGIAPNVRIVEPPLGGGGGNTRVTTLYFRPLENNRQLVVVAEPPFAAAQLAGVAKEAELLASKEYQAIRVELRPAPGEGEAHVLATRLLPVSENSPDRAFKVLDSLVEPGQLTFAVVEYGEVVVWRINALAGQFDKAALNRADWTQRTNPGNRPSAKLSRNKDGMVQVGVADGMVVNPTEYMFTQGREGWSFKRGQ